MIEIVPSILSADYSRLGDQLRLLEKSGLKKVHLDIMDGHFVPTISFGPILIKSLVGVTGLSFDIHMMTQNPEQHFDELILEGTEYITVHKEACIQLLKTIRRIKSMGYKAGVSLNPETRVSELTAVIEEADLVLLMSVNPGFGGQKFMPSTIEKIRELNDMKKDRNPGLKIEVDGGITLGNILSIREAGADMAVVGSDILKSGEIEKRVGQYFEILGK